jgi:rubrerythrin
MDIFQDPSERIDRVEKEEERHVEELDRLEQEKRLAEEPDAEQPNSEEPSNEGLQPPSSDQAR